MEDALFNMGVIYKEQLLDYGEAIKAFELLLEKFPESRFTPQVMYYMYDLCNSTQQPERAAYYKGQLLAHYPESHYSMLLNNPNYIAELEKAELQVTRLYEGIFSAYQAEAYPRVINDAEDAILEYSDDPLVPKFKYIKALAVGALEGKEAMKVELDSLIAQHPGTEESIQAQEIIDYMFVAFPVIREAEEARVAEEVYTVFDTLQPHFFLLVLDGSENINQVSFDLLNYNLDHFNQYELDIERLELTDGYRMLVVRTFNNARAAERYLQVISENSSGILAGIPADHYKMMLISLDNYQILSDEKVHNPYYLFYRKHYLTQE
jgi:outer membrane protein assembly factor BamD (BamD/ComL family)